jgi:hypothetical protein
MLHLRAVLSASLLSFVVACGGGGSSGGPDAAPPGPDAAPDRCAPAASCTAVGTSCLNLFENQGSASFAVRMSELDLTAPIALTKGVIAATLTSAIWPKLSACNVAGAATFNWLLQFNTGTSSLTFGSAQPVADATTGYTIDTPVSTGVTIDSYQKFTSTAADATITMYLDAAATQQIALPLRRLVFSGTLSGDHDCVGRYNSAGLDPASACVGDATHPTFLPDATVNGVIGLEDADAVIIGPLSQSLCVLLSGDATTYGDGGHPAKCKRAGTGMITFQGDACTVLGGPCTDAVTFSGAFAASAVKVN